MRRALALLVAGCLISLGAVANAEEPSPTPTTSPEATQPAPTATPSPTEPPAAEPSPQPQPSVEPSSSESAPASEDEIAAEVPAAASLTVNSTGPHSGTMILAGDYHYIWRGAAAANQNITIWWNNPNYDTQWRVMTSGAAKADGSFELRHRVGPWSNDYRFTYTNGATPGAGASPVVTVQVRDVSSSLGVATTGDSQDGKFIAGSGQYLATGLAPANARVTMWWNNPNFDSTWRVLTTTTATSAGAYRLTHPIGPWSATFRFATTTGAAPTAETPYRSVRVIPRPVNMTLKSSGIHHGTDYAVNSGNYVFIGTATPNATVQLWWDAPADGLGWRRGTSGKANASGAFTIQSKIGPWLATYRWTATLGEQPEPDAAAATVRIVRSPSSLTVDTTGQRSEGALIPGDGSYVFQGKALPNSPVVIWWNNPSFDGHWRTMATTTADSSGNYRVTKPIGPWPATFRFAATWGDTPKGWDAAPVSVNVGQILGARVSHTTSAELGASWRAGCPVGAGSLSTITMNYWTPSGAMARGQIIVREDLAARTIAIFRAAFDQRFPITKMKLASQYPGAKDETMMADDNTSGFNCRTVVGNPYRMSPHSYGYAIDINPVTNPYYAAGRWYPSSAYSTGRSASIPGMHMSHTVFPVQFRAHGGHWGDCYRDYHHFELTTKRC